MSVQGSCSSWTLALKPHKGGHIVEFFSGDGSCLLVFSVLVLCVDFSMSWSPCLCGGGLVVAYMTTSDPVLVNRDLCNRHPDVDSWP